MTDIIPFDFETNAVRMVMQEGEPWFVAADVCRVLEHSNPRQAIRILDEHQVRLIDLNTVTLSYGIQPSKRGNPNVSIISEGGLYKLVMRSDLAVKPGTVQHRFANFVVDELLPAIRRDGAYGLTDPGLAAKRAAYAALPEAHQERALQRAEAVRLVNSLIGAGATVTAAVNEAAEQYELSARTIWSARRATYMVAERDIPAALAPKWSGPRGMLAPCHPEALALYLELAATGARLSHCYQRMMDVAAEHGWQPIPCDRTLRRAAAKRDIVRVH